MLHIGGNVQSAVIGMKNARVVERLKNGSMLFEFDVERRRHLRFLNSFHFSGFI